MSNWRKEVASFAALQRRIKQLEDDNQQLREQLEEAHFIWRNQARLLNALQQGHNVQMIVDPTLPPNTVLVPYDQIATELEIQYQQGASEGALVVSEAIGAIERAVRAVRAHISAIQTCAMCDNGNRTRATLQRILSEFVGSVQNLEVENRKQYDNALIQFNWNAVDQAMDYWNSLREQTVMFLAQKSDAAQENLRALVAKNDAVMEAIYAEIANTKRRGRSRSKVRELIGKMAADYPEPESGNWWRLGVDIYEVLRNIPETARRAGEGIQQQAFELLEPLVVMERTDPATGKKIRERRDLGILISECRAEFLKH